MIQTSGGHTLPFMRSSSAVGPRPIGVTDTTSAYLNRTYVNGIPSHVYARLGIEPEEDETRAQSSLPALIQGALAGLIEPVTIIPGVGEYRDSLAMSNHDSLMGKLAYGTGYLVSSLIPGTLALKGARAVLGATRLLRASDVVQDITRARRFAEGAIAGGLFTAGMDADSWEEKMVQLGVASVTGGAVDVALGGLTRAVSTTARKGAPSPAVGDAVKKTLEAGEVPDDFSAVVLSRALSFADEVFPQRNRSVAQDRAKMLTGFRKLSLEELREGELRIVQGFDVDASGVSDLLDHLGDLVEYHTVTRGKLTDVLVARKGQLPTASVGHYKRYGYLPGQVGRHNGADYVVLQRAKGKLEARRFGDPFDQTVYRFDEGELSWTSYAIGSEQAAPGVHRLVAKFITEHSLYPKDGFLPAFSNFVAKNKLTEPQAVELQKLLGQRQVLALESMGANYNEIAKRIQAGFKEQLKPHELPKPNLYSQAAEVGYLARPFRGEDGKIRINLVDFVNGEHFDLANESAARLFLQNRKRTGRDILETLVPTLEFPSDLVRTRAVPPMEVHAQGALKDYGVLKLGPGFKSLSRIMPRIMAIKRIQDRMIQEGITGPDGRVPPVFDLVENLRLATMAKARDAEPFRRRLESLWQTYHSRIDSEHYEGIVSMLEVPAGDREAVRKLYGLSADEVKLSEEMRQYFADMLQPLLKSENIEITPEKVIENYFPHYRIRPKNGQLSSMTRPELIEKGTHEKVVQFLNEMDRMGTLSQWETNPFSVMSRYTNAAFGKMHVAKPAEELQSLIRELNKVRTGDWQVLNRLLSEYVVLSFGGEDEATRTLMSSFLEELSDRLGMGINQRSAQRIVNNLLSSNYGAFMGFRPALAFRNLTQTLFTTYPVLGEKYTAYGLTVVANRWTNVVEEMIQKGVLKTGALSVPGEDMMVRGAFQRMLREEAGDSVSRLEHATELLANFGHFSLAGADKVAGVPLGPVGRWMGLYTRSDVFNRMVAWKGGRAMARDAISDWVEHRDDAKLIRDVSGSFLGESRMAEFLNLVKNNAREEAEDYIGRAVADESQFMYQLGAGPAAFSSMWGRLIGQYGTWPTWYVELLHRGMTRGTGAEKLAFMGRTVAAHAALFGAGWALGVNVWRWLPATSFSWAGGPIVDVGMDARDLIGGFSVKGEPTAAQSLVLSKYGLKRSTDGGLPVELGDPYKLWRSTLGMFTPGAYALNDIYTGVTSEDYNDQEALIRSMGFHPSGSDWPMMQLPTRGSSSSGRAQFYR